MLFWEWVTDPMNIDHLQGASHSLSTLRCCQISQLTVDSFSPNTAALERIVLSMKLKLYVTKSRGRIQISILRTTLLLKAELKKSWLLSDAPSVSTASI
jgi:hypothetical protein